MAVSYKVVSKRPGGMAGERSPRYFPVVTKRDITKIKMAFLPSKVIKKTLGSTDFRKVK